MNRRQAFGNPRRSGIRANRNDPGRINPTAPGGARQRRRRRLSPVCAVILLLCAVASLHADDWKLVWSDEFDHNGRPDPSKWAYEVGMIRNNEPQCYTRSLRNARVENGCLVLEAAKGAIFNGEALNPFAKKKTLDDRLFQEYSSASICTLGKAAWLYGKFEIRAKLPPQAGTWPAFWTLGANHSKVPWPRCGEIDVMERMWQRNGDPGSAIMSVLHFKRLLQLKKRDLAENSSSFFHMTPVPGATMGFHVYAMEWYPDRIDFLIDGVPCHSVDMMAVDRLSVENPFRKPQYLLLSLALNRRNKGFREASFPARFEIDYARVYQKKGAGL